MCLSAHVSFTFVCVYVCQDLYVDCVVISCVCLSLFLCVSVPEKADLRELCSTFTPLLIHPSLLLCLPGWTGGSEKAEGERGKGRTNRQKWMSSKEGQDRQTNTHFVVSVSCIQEFHVRNLFSLLCVWLLSTLNVFVILKQPVFATDCYLRNCSYSSNRRHWLWVFSFFFPSHIIRWSSQQAVGGQGSQDSEHSHRKRLGVCELFETEGSTMEQFPSILFTSFYSFLCVKSQTLL